MATPQASEVIAAGAAVGIAAATIPIIMPSDIMIVGAFIALGSTLSSLFREELSTTKSKVISAITGATFGAAVTFAVSLFIADKSGLPFQVILPGVALAASMPGDLWIKWAFNPPEFIKSLVYKFAPFLEPKK